MTGKRLHAGSSRADDVAGLPGGWHDEIVCHTFCRNKDGTITVVALVNVYDGQGGCYSADRTIRLSPRENTRLRHRF